MPAFRKFVVGNMTTPIAGLRRVGRVDFDKPPTGTFSLEGEGLSKLRPCRVTVAFCKAMVFCHTFEVQFLNRDGLKAVHDFTRFLMHKGMTTIPDALMDTRHYLTRLAALFGAFF